MKYFHKSLYFPNQIFQNGYVTPCYSSCQNGEGLHGCHSSNSFYFLMNLICLFQRFLWLELQSTSFVADQKLRIWILLEMQIPNSKLEMSPSLNFGLIQAFGIGRILGCWRQKLVALLDMMRTSLTVWKRSQRFESRRGASM
ncbi:uncharacterized protein LOC103958384 isoform X1 [Pyrus x bretschneideri]|uniref:uncharacterized protein LOC103958384 isoform X1 n=1 Tax=Pyrus x bretschneideri TaxID=225117 RepID=UPI002030396F|nr:uncharacterized protein LOC103958384 isoform X1 [Pyrus x bretschneideri]